MFQSPQISESLVETIETPSEEMAGKMQVVLGILQTLWSESPSEKIVLVSNFTKTLDILQEVCSRKSYKTCRLDGSTPLTKRQEIVDCFNRESSDICKLLCSTTINFYLKFSCFSPEYQSRWCWTQLGWCIKTCSFRPRLESCS